MLLKKIAFAFAVLPFLFSFEAYAQSDRSTYSASTRGTSVTIPEQRVRELCGDIDGCAVRIAMYNWDGLRRTASRDTILYYNSSNGNWRDLQGDTQGTTGNSGTQHIIQAWGCYFTDGRYRNWSNLGDTSKDFAVLAWDQYSGQTCRVTLID
ncbi:hypothetical protein [Marinibactrum halimedae]|uniref:Uncharacterized protein n=1 Tax=Marinibactrum halimedae TaxID=1444977 RepID=A0AA37TCN7_9GAMM|nr:hypothetical protein [Marinibactrum halimedae]MCD9460929.1 hypothetical protein [Marinibactrum halimedae]GLS27400.1 hypothetical protein GCM10007877_31190 [Marinibactrum halimedae]